MNAYCPDHYCPLDTDTHGQKFCYRCDAEEGLKRNAIDAEALRDKYFDQKLHEMRDEGRRR